MVTTAVTVVVVSTRYVNQRLTLDVFSRKMNVMIIGTVIVVVVRINNVKKMFHLVLKAQQVRLNEVFLDTKQHANINVHF